MAKMNLPNQLTILRMVMIPFFMVFQLGGTAAGNIVALVLFALASLTDLLDGHIARKYNLVTNFGKLMDPLADKLLTFAAFLGFLQLGLTSAYPIMIMLAREFLVTSVRLIALESGGKVIAANIWGKLKTIMQMLSVCVILLLSCLQNPWAVGLLPWLAPLLIWICAGITLFSGATYVWDNKSLFSQ